MTLIIIKSLRDGYYLAGLARDQCRFGVERECVVGDGFNFALEMRRRVPTPPPNTGFNSVL